MPASAQSYGGSSRTRQRCTVHLQRYMLTRVRARLRPWVAREVAALFQAKSLPAARQRLAALRKRWDRELPEAMACLQDGFAATAFDRFPPGALGEDPDDERKRLHGVIKRRIRAVGAFPDRASALRLITAGALKVAAIWSDRRHVDVSLLEQEVDQAA